MKNLILGVHVSIAGSIELSVDRAVNLNCNTFQIFTRNPRGWKAKKLSQTKIDNFHQKISDSNISPIFAHMPYLVNLASNDDLILKKSINMFKEELKRCNALNIPFLVTHPGRNKRRSKKENLNQIINSLNLILNDYSGKTKILLENIAGKKEIFGSSIQDIVNLVKFIDKSEHLGICFDTCHAYAAGYNLRKNEVIENILEKIERDVGLKKLSCIHCNDSKYDLGSGKDRHEHIGIGKIGKIGFKKILANEKFRRVPFVCETPINDLRDDRGNLEYIRKLLKEINR